ncbi:Phosphate-binding protein PstS 1 [Dinochytrium kinnereticum]|nr:Phosphate-binding protein PstS 1 [Dinochytrium kinnereticum]
MAQTTIAQTFSRTVNITAGGATFPENVYQKWSTLYPAVASNRNIQVFSTYIRGLGSGSGKRALISSATTGFSYAGTDASISENERSLSNNTLRLLPILAGAMVLIYFLPGFDGQLKLSREAVVGIFNGTISMWDDPILLKDNSGASLKKERIVLVVRDDDSGSTEVMNRALKSFNPKWETAGYSRKLQGTSGWPKRDRAMVGTGNVVLEVVRTEFSIGYVDLGYNLPFASIINRENQPTLPSLEGMRSAVSNANTSSLNVSNSYLAIVDQPGGKSYPLTALTYFAIRLGNPRSCVNVYELIRFILWALEDENASTLANSAHFVTLSSDFQRFSRSILDQLRCILPGDDPFKSVVEQARADIRGERLDMSGIGFMSGVVVILWRVETKPSITGRGTSSNIIDVKNCEKEVPQKNAAISFNSPLNWKGRAFVWRVMRFALGALYEFMLIGFGVTAVKTVSQDIFFGRLLFGEVAFGGSLLLLFEHAHSDFEEQMKKVKALSRYVLMLMRNSTKILVLATRRHPITPIIARSVTKDQRVMIKKYLSFVLWAEFSEASLLFCRKIPITFVCIVILFQAYTLNPLILAIALMETLTLKLSFTRCCGPFEMLKKYVWVMELPHIRDEARIEENEDGRVSRRSTGTRSLTGDGDAEGAVRKRLSIMKETELPTLGEEGFGSQAFIP